MFDLSIGSYNQCTTSQVRLRRCTSGTAAHLNESVIKSRSLVAALDILARVVWAPNVVATCVAQRWAFSDLNGHDSCQVGHVVV
jgi:hypothetical protein